MKLVTVFFVLALAACGSPDDKKAKITYPARNINYKITFEATEGGEALFTLTQTDSSQAPIHPDDYDVAVKEKESDIVSYVLKSELSTDLNGDGLYGVGDTLTVSEPSEEYLQKKNFVSKDVVIAFDKVDGNKVVFEAVENSKYR